MSTKREYAKRLSPKGLSDADFLKLAISERSIPEPNSGCWLWTASTNKGYGSFQHKNKSILAHRLSWEIVNGPIPDGLVACHKCDTPACINPDHIFLGTQKDNGIDMANKQRHAAGKRGFGEKLTRLQAEKIRADPRTQAVIASSYGVSAALVSRIKGNLAWKPIFGATQSD